MIVLTKVKLKTQLNVVNIIRLRYLKNGQFHFLNTGSKTVLNAKDLARGSNVYFPCQNIHWPQHKKNDYFWPT